MRGISNSITTKMTSLTLPTKVRFIKRQSLVQSLKELASDAKTVLFLEDDPVLTALILPVIEKQITHGDLLWIKEIPPVLTTKAVIQTLKDLKSFEPQHFLVIGDDRTLDLAKAVSSVLPFVSQSMDEKSVLKTLREPLAPAHFERVSLKAVLTTPQCGSALTGWVSVFDEATEALILLKHPNLAYDDALIFMDESLTLSPSQLLTSAFKAMSQAADAYWSKTATPPIRQLSLGAIRRIVMTLPILLKKSNHLEAREQLMIGSLMAAFALSNTRLSAATATGLALNMLNGMDPGLASVLILPELLRHNLGALPNPESLYEAFNIDNPEGLMSCIENNATGFLAVKLSDYGIQAEDLNRLSAAVLSLDTLQNNLVDLSEDQLTAFLKRHC